MNVFCDQVNAYFSLVITFSEVHCIADQLLLTDFLDQKRCLDCDEMSVVCDQMNAYFSL